MNDIPQTQLNAFERMYDKHIKGQISDETIEELCKKDLLGALSLEDLEIDDLEEIFREFMQSYLDIESYDISPLTDTDDGWTKWQAVYNDEHLAPKAATLFTNHVYSVAHDTILQHHGSGPIAQVAKALGLKRITHIVTSGSPAGSNRPPRALAVYERGGYDGPEEEPEPNIGDFPEVSSYDVTPGPLTSGDPDISVGVGAGDEEGTTTLQELLGASPELAEHVRDIRDKRASQPEALDVPGVIVADIISLDTVRNAPPKGRSITGDDDNSGDSN